MESQTAKDQVGRTVVVPKYPKRIVSLVPSQTELLFELGLGDRVVGITKFCVHPNKWFATKTRVGGTKKLNFDTISALDPDLIIANKEENNRADVERLEKAFPVWVSNVNDLSSALEMIRSIGEITASSTSSILAEIKDDFEQLQPIHPKRKTLYLIWKNPFMAAGSNTFIHHIMERCGFENALKEVRYPELSEEALKELDPEFVFLSSEPYPFNAGHIAELQSVLPDACIRLVDGEMFSWYGSRLKLAPAYFSKLVASIAK